MANRKSQITNRKFSLVASSLVSWFRRHARPLPWRDRPSPYGIWVSEIMLQQTQVKTVIPYWERWMRVLPDIPALARADQSRVLKLWEGLGYYRRARHLHAAAKQLAAQNNGRLPQTLVELRRLPGIGRYTAGAIASIAFHQPAPIVDGNVSRVLSRLFAIRASTRRAGSQARLWKIADRLVHHASVAGGNSAECNQALMELGATVCTPRQPDCPACPVRSVCSAFARNQVLRFPARARRPPLVRRRFRAFVAEREGLFAVRQRPQGGINGLLWEFPNVEAAIKIAAPAQAQTLFGMRPVRCRPWMDFEHTITRSRITLEVYRVRLRPASTRMPGLLWLAWSELRELPLAAAHRRIVTQAETAERSGSLIGNRRKRRSQS